MLANAVSQKVGRVTFMSPLPDSRWLYRLAQGCPSGGGRGRDARSRKPAGAEFQAGQMHTGQQGSHMTRAEG